MDNEEDYVELHKLLAKCKFNIVREQVKFNHANIGHTDIVNYYDKKIKQIEELMVDIPIIVKGNEI